MNTVTDTAVETEEYKRCYNCRRWCLADEWYKCDECGYGYCGECMVTGEDTCRGCDKGQ